MAQQPPHSNPPDSQDLVARVNTAPEDEPEEAEEWQPATPATVEGTTEPDAPPARAPLPQVVLLGLLAVIVIAISMYVILQGVFEMIPD